MRITLYPGELRRLARRYSTPERIRIAHQIEAGARARATVVTGEFASNYATEVDGENVRVVNNDEAASYIVLGTSDTPPHAELIDEARKYGRYSGVKPKRG